MNALVINSYGPPTTSNFVYKQVNKPKITKPKHVLVKIKAIGTNPGEMILSSGKVSAFMPLKFPAILGLDYSGVIEEIGSGVENLEIGQEVHGQFRSPTMNGTYAEYIVVEQGNDVIVIKPSTLSHEEAAAFGTAASTAYEGIVNVCNIKQNDGKRILIVGAAGGIGSYSVGISKALGANVTAICSTGNMDIVKSLGADKVIDHRSPTFINDLKSCELFDCILDTVGGNDYYYLLEPLLKRGGIFSTTVLGPVLHGFGDNFSLFALIKAVVQSKWRNLVSKTRYYVVSILNSNNTHVYVAVDEWLTSGKMKSPNLQCVPLSEGVTGLDKLEKHQISGKLIFIP